MEYFRRLVGALQETLDYVSSFTTYLLGDETHPGAEGTGRTRELGHRSSRHNSEVETAHSGDISPHLNTFERPRTIEVTPFNQELRVASEAVGNGTRATEAFPEPSTLACKCEGQEVDGQKPSETPQFLADAPKTSPTATMLGNDWQSDLEGLALIQCLHQWKPEGTTLMEGIQPEDLEGVGLDSESSPDWEQDRPMTGEREQNGAGGTDGAQQRELEGTMWIEDTEQKKPDWALFLTEQPHGTGEIKHERLKAESQHLEEEEEEEVEEEPAAEWDQQGEASEGIQQAMLERTETEGEQEGLLEEAKHRRETGETVMTFEEQDWDPKRGTEERNSLQSALEGTFTEDHQQAEPEGPLRKEAHIEDKQCEEDMEGVWGGTSEKLLEKDLEVEVLEKTRGAPEWTERSLWEEPTGSRASFDAGLDAREQIVVEPERLTEKLEKEEVVEVVMLEDAETSGIWKWEPEGTERSLHEEPMESRGPINMCLFGGEQIAGEPEKLTGEQEPIEVVIMEEAETEGGHQPCEPAGSVQEEPKGSDASLLDMHLFGGEQTVVEPESLTENQEDVAVVAESGRHRQQEAEKMARHLQKELNKSRAFLAADQFGGEQIVEEPEKLTEEAEEVVTVVVLEEGETGGHQPWEPEGNLHKETKGSNSSLLDMHLFGGEQTVVEPESLTENQEDVAVVVLEEAETGGHQPWEPEMKERNLQQDPTASRTPLSAGLFGGEQIVVEPETEERAAAVAAVVLGEAETSGHQPWELETKERSLQQDPTEIRTPLNAGLSGGEQIVAEPEKMTEQQQVVTVVVLEEAETGGHQSWEPEGSLQEEPTGNRLFAGPSILPDEVLSLDTSAQKERVMLRRKSSIRRAPSLKKPRLPIETQPTENQPTENQPMETQPAAANLTEPVPSQPQAPRQPNLRRSGFGPMHPNMMAELQTRLRRPQ